LYGYRTTLDKALDSTLKTLAWYQYIAPTCGALYANIQSDAQNPPRPAAAGMGLAQFHDIAGP
jgi:hypothetical protein